MKHNFGAGSGYVLLIALGKMDIPDRLGQDVLLIALGKMVIPSQFKLYEAVWSCMELYGATNISLMARTLVLHVYTCLNSIY